MKVNKDDSQQERKGLEKNLDLSVFTVLPKTQVIKISSRRKWACITSVFIYFSCFLWVGVPRQCIGNALGWMLRTIHRIVIRETQELLMRQWNVLPSRIECRVLASSGRGEAGRTVLPSCICKHILRKKLGWVSGEHYKRLVLDKRLSSLPASGVTKWDRGPQQCLLRSKAVF